MRKKLHSLFVVTAFSGCVVAGTTAGAAIDIGAFGSTRSLRPLSGPDYSNLRSQLLNPANFGPAGIVQESVVFAPDVATVTPAALAGLEFFVVSEVASISAAETTALRNFVLGGGCLILATNSSAGDRPGASLTLAALDGGSITDPVGGNNGSNAATVIGSASSTSGPFGNLPLNSTLGATISSTLNPGSATTVIARNDTFVMLGEIPLGTLGAGAGAVLAMSDVIGMNFFIGPPATGLDNVNNATLLKNFIGGKVVPEPACAAFAFVTAPLLARRRRVHA